jgi:hypothetical protein
MYYADARGQESFELSDIDPMSDGTLVMGLCTLDGDLSSAQHGAMYRHMLQDAILQCETPTKFTPEARPRARLVGPKRRGRAHESRSRFVDMDDQWTFQCQIQKRHPLCDETSTDETTPKTRPTSAASRTKPRDCIWTSMFPALWSVRCVCQCQTYDSASQCATGFVKDSSGVRQCHQLIKISRSI